MKKKERMRDVNIKFGKIACTWVSTRRVKVTPNCAGGTGTQWYYAIECPNQDLLVYSLVRRELEVYADLWRTCTTNRAVCDNSFSSGLDASCKANWDIDKDKYTTCLRRAAMFYQSVSIFGSGTFKNTQNEDCWCDQNYIRDESLIKENKPWTWTLYKNH